eukprot:scaffold422_cov399-Prasinococcus_capsulatus_cf.AAC.1
MYRHSDTGEGPSAPQGSSTTAPARPTLPLRSPDSARGVLTRRSACHRFLAERSEDRKPERRCRRSAAWRKPSS